MRREGAKEREYIIDMFTVLCNVHLRRELWNGLVKLLLLKQISNGQSVLNLNLHLSSEWEFHEIHVKKGHKKGHTMYIYTLQANVMYGTESLESVFFFFFFLMKLQCYAEFFADLWSFDIIASENPLWLLLKK